VIGDLRFALRPIARRPVASATIVAVLGLGSGVPAAVYTTYNTMNDQPAPGVRENPALVRLRGKEQPPERGAWDPRELSYSEYRAFSDRRDLFTATAAWSTQTVTFDLGDAESATAAQMHFVDGEYFQTAGIRIPLGTTLPMPPRADQSAGELVAIINNAMWQDLFGGLTDVIGKSVRVNGAIVRIVGVAPPLFNGIAPSGSRTLWMPLASRATVLRTTPRSLTDPDSALLSGAALLAPGVSMDRASNAVQLLSEQSVARMTPAGDKRVRTADVVPLRASTSLPEDPERWVVSVMFAAVGVLVLVLACTNVSALVIGNGVTRGQEIAVRLSLGASRRRLVRQLITESCVLAVCGGIAGLACYAAFTRFAATALPGLALELDLGTVGYTMLVAIATGVLFGLSPALHATRSSVSEVLKGGGGTGGASSRTRLQSSFVVAQIAVTQPLLMGIAMLLGLLVGDRRQTAESAVSSRVLQLAFDLRRAGADSRARLDAAMQELTTIPGIERVAREANGAGRIDFTVHEESRAGLLRDGSMSVSVEGTDPGYFAILGFPILRGRDVAPSDTTLPYRPVIIGSSVAHDLWGNADPLGRRFRQSAGGKALERDAVIVGVYDDSRPTTAGPGLRVYAYDNEPWRSNGFLARTTGPGRALESIVRDRIHDAVPEIPLLEIATLEETMAARREEMARMSMGASVSGGLVLLLASIGLYGVIGLAVAQRRREIGIRIALGARPIAVVALLFRQGLWLGALGLVIGLPFSIGALTLIRNVLAGTSDGSASVSPAILGTMVALAVLAVAAFATWLPARRAASIAPTLALRAE
jgi:predicted permease